MLKTLGEKYFKFLICTVDVSRKNAHWIILITVLLTSGLGYYITKNISINTNTIDMLDASLPFRKLDDDLDKTFPQFSGLIVAVVESSSLIRANDNAELLAKKLKQSTDILNSVYRPGQGSFFKTNGLLYLDTDKLWDLSERLSEAQPFIGALSYDPSLRGLFSMLGHSLDEDLGAENKKQLATMFNRINTSIEAQIAGKEEYQSWREGMIDESDAPGKIYRSFILIQPRFNYSTLQPGQEAIKKIRDVIVQLGLNDQPDLRVRLTGSVAMEDEELDSVAKGAGIATMLSFLLVCIILFIGLGAPRLVISILLTLLAGLVWTAAFATFAIGSLNLISVTFAVLFIGLGVDFGIQFGMRYREEFAGQGTHSAALSLAAKGTGGALTLAAVAAALSFFSFSPTSYRGLAELGIIAGAGMFIALIANLTLLPALFTLMPLKNRPARKPGEDIYRSGFSVRKYRRFILLLAIIAGGWAIYQAPKMKFDFNPLNMKDPDAESVKTFIDLLSDPDTTPYTIEIIAGNLDEADQLATKLEKLEVVDKTVTLSSYVPGDQDEKMGIIDDMNVTLLPILRQGPPGAAPSTDEEVNAINVFRNKLATAIQKENSNSIYRESLQRLGKNIDALKTQPGWPAIIVRNLRQRILGDLPEGLAELRQQLSPQAITLDKLPKDIKERYVAPDGRARVEVFPEEDLSDNDALRRFVRDIQKIAPDATSSPVALLEGGDAVVHATLLATMIALLAAISLLIIVLRSIVDVLLVLMPLVLAALLTMATSVTVGLDFNLANIIALPLLLGLGVAFGIYLVLRKRSGMDVDHLMHSSTSRAVLFSALTTMATFGTLSFTHHKGMSSMGLLLMLALTFALICTLVILPAIMAEIDEYLRQVKLKLTGKVEKVDQD